MFDRVLNTSLETYAKLKQGSLILRGQLSLFSPFVTSQSGITCSKLTIEILEHGWNML